MSELTAQQVAPPAVREARPDAAPTVSVVIASSCERTSLDACLAALLPQCERYGVEIVVARTAEPAELARLSAVYPAVRFVSIHQPATIPELRAAGMRAAQGDIVAFTEDHYLVAPDWLAQMLRGQSWMPGHGSGAIDDLPSEHAGAGSPPTVSI